MKQQAFLKINPADSVVVCLQPIAKGTQIEVDGKSVILLQDTPAGHKVLIEDKAEGEDIIKYGYPIGHAKTALKAGEWVNEDNLKTNLSGKLEYTYNPVGEKLTIPCENRTFKGYVRKNGDVGVRNEVWIVPTVGCVNGIAEKLAEKLREETKCEGIDAVYTWHHNYGCSQLSDDHENTRKVLRDLVLHPNAGAVLVLSLGCENNQPKDFMEMLGDYDKDRIKLLITQDVDGDEVEAGMEILRDLYKTAKEDKREDVPVSKLRVGLKCGGSDGFSGITANPLVGEFSDWLVAQGGTSILTEVPEMFGAETILMNRCETKELFEDTVKLVNDFKEYFLSHGEPVGENPSPGNKKGGISTLEDKALGCTQKCGRAPVSGVLSYGDRLKVNGLNLLSAPGNDLVASTALASAGCHIVLFTTGRGTPFGTFVPTMKIATNPTLASRKANWIDFNAGQLIEGKDMLTVRNEFIDKVLAVASGEQSRNEINGYREISIFKNGVTL
ncbi:MAG: altronate dehydratase family protein [Bacteroidales bacterium]|nr:altronate dehydratase family protein [Bacteroidales bacterium]MCM1148247.1 altronate dehydratase family protein [Bacteroidales bacterium]MCM1206570.1 altronate dehydratase family protein [Bacillota bacterium]MCM1510528.1 altronate dehydratase family protein [Clostridium sp.]